MKTGRNHPCPCGSGNKYKKCCESGGIQTPSSTAVNSEALSGLYDKAVKLYESGDIRSAETICKKVLELQPYNVETLQLSGAVAERLGQYGRAVEYFRLAISADPARADSHYSCGVALHRQGKLEEAVMCYRQAIQLKPGYDEGTGNLIAILINDEELLNRDWLMSDTHQDSCSFPVQAGLCQLIRQITTDAAIKGRRAALDHFLQSIKFLDLTLIDCVYLLLLAQGLQQKNWYDDPLLPLPFSQEHFVRLMEDKTLKLMNLRRLLLDRCLRYHLHSAREWNRLLFEKIMVPTIEQALLLEDYALAIYLNGKTMVSYAQQPHTEEQWTSASGMLEPYFSAAAEKLKTRYGCCLSVTAIDADNAVPVVGFVTEWTNTGCSGDDVLWNLLEALARLDPQFVKPILYVYYGISREFENNCATHGIEIRRLDLIAENPAVDRYIQRLLALKMQVEQDRADALVYLGVSEAPAVLAGALRLAPVQIYWTLGFKHKNLGHWWDSYMAGGASISDEPWQNGGWWQTPMLMHDLYPANESDEGKALHQEIWSIRQRFLADYAVILGTIARSQKIGNPEFMEALAGILRKNPRAVFLWCGDAVEPAHIREMMARRGISDRCIFLGWVNGKNFAKLLDVHLDSFPFPSGLSMYETMSAGAAFVWMDGHESRQMSAWATGVLPLLRGSVGSREDQKDAHSIFTHPETGENLFLLAGNCEEYVDNAQRLIDDVDFRRAVGRAGRLFMERFVHDTGHTARIYAEHFLEVIRLKTGV